MRKLLLTLSVILAITSCGHHQPALSKRRTINVATVYAMTDTSARKYPFISEPFRTAQLAFRVNGHITVLNLQEGQFFRRGQVIAALDNQDFVVRKRRAAAIYRQTRAEYERMARLLKMNNVSEQEYEQAKADYERAKADYDIAIDELSRTRLTAPFDGYIQTLHAERYQDVTTGQTIVTFIDMSRIKAEAYVPEDVATQLQQDISGNICRISLDRINDRTFKPAETYITRTTTDNSLAFKLTVLIDNRHTQLPGGMSGNILINRPLMSTHSVAVPQEAVWNGPDGKCYVWMISRKGRVSRRQVITECLLEHGMIEIKNGLKPGERVAITGLDFLAEGDFVTIASGKTTDNSLQEGPVK